MSTAPIVATFIGAMGCFALWVAVLVRSSALREVRGSHVAMDRADSLPASAAWGSPAHAQPALTDRRFVQGLAIAALAGLLFVSAYLGSSRGSFRNPG